MYPNGQERTRLSVAAWKFERIGGIGRNKLRRPKPSRKEPQPASQTPGQ